MGFPWCRSRPDLMSAKWLKERQRLEQRIEFHGVRISFPIKKVLNDSALWNKAKLKRSA